MNIHKKQTKTRQMKINKFQHPNSIDEWNNLERLLENFL